MVGHGQLGERERVLLSIAERAGAVRLQPGGADGLLVTLTGKGSPRLAQAAIKAARDRGWEAYRSIERYSADGQTCRRRQILDHFGDDSEAAPQGRCCDVCDPDPRLAGALRAAAQAGSSGRRRGAGASAASRAGGGSSPGDRAAADVPFAEGPPVDEREFERLRAWRMGRAEGKPAYTVASNAVLEQVLQARPASPRELLAIRGVGPAFCEKHGESLLAELAALAGG
jgi:ATP-dependent DNA helicase RecQ